jgi:sugar (pentulose or hexulose) kinase
MEYRMVFDAGSKILKCAIADENNSIIALESIIPEVVRSEDGFGRSWKITDYWKNLLQLAEKTIKKTSIDPQKIRFITSSTIRPSCVFSDEDFNPLYIGSSFDILGIHYGDEIDEQFTELTGESLYQSTGHFPSFLMPPARFEWLRNNPDFIDNKTIAHYIPLDSWILMKLGGEFHTNYTSAMESGFFDVRKKLWHDEWYSIFDIDDSFFPYPIQSGEIVGNVSSKIKDKLKLSSDTEIVAGITDTQAALLASNSINPGDIGVVLGTTTPVQAVAEKFYISKTERVWSTGISVKNLCDNYIVESNMGITGQVIKWAAHLFVSKNKKGISEPTVKQYEDLGKQYQEFDEYEQEESLELVSSQSVFANLGPSTLESVSSERSGGEFYFPSPGGVDEFFISQKQLIGAVFDNIMFAVSRNIEIAKEIAQLEKISLSILGGPSRYKLLSQRIADLHNIPVKHLSNHEASIQGLLILCDVASGEIKNPSDLNKYLAEKGELTNIEPRSTMTEKLQEKYNKWKRITKI